MRTPAFCLAYAIPILFATQVYGQSNVSGTWLGILRQTPGGTEPEFGFELRLVQTGAKVTGTARIAVPANNKYYAIMEVSGNVQGNTLEFLETSIIENHPEPGTYWCIKRGDLKFSEPAGHARLEGSWTASNCAPGTIEVFRKSEDQEPEEGQRRKAMRLACSAPSGSLGRDAICPNFDPSYVDKFYFNWCAGGVGDLYEKNKRTLEEPATDENIERWAEMETKYFRDQDTCTAILGGLLSQEKRVEWMKEARGRRRNQK